MDRQDREEIGNGGVGPYAHERARLVSMSTLERWTVSEDEPDIRGWDVRTASGRRLGAVSDLLIDESTGDVEFLDIDLPESDRRTFVPVRVVQIDRARRVIVMDSADLPESDISRGERSATSERRVADARSVRYPSRQRDDAASGPGSPERRRADRRHIERMSTEF